MKRLAIVGFGGAGYNAAKAARSVSPDAEIDVFDGFPGQFIGK